MSSWLPHKALLALAFLVLASCTTSSSPGTDAEEGDDPLDANDSGGEEGGEGEQLPIVPGPLTFLFDEVGVAADRLCDHDGDGLLDNAIADLGHPASAITAMGLSSYMQGYVSEQGVRLLLALPWVDDVTTPDDPEMILLVFGGEDTDDPVDPSDDFSGGEPFFVRWESLDSCGEPLFPFDSASIDDGQLLAEGGLIPIAGFNNLVVTTPVMEGHIAPGGESAELTLCAYGTIRDLGTVPAMDVMGDYSFLEAFLWGGEAFGISTMPGLTPDLDLDGDGLERVFIDEDGHITECLDGDSTQIPGADCWLDERMADGFSLTFSASGIPAAFAGPQPRWEELVGGSCDNPPEQSLWDGP